MKEMVEHQRKKPFMETSLSIVSEALEAFREFTGDGDVQIQTVQVFMRVVMAGGATIDYAALEKVTGVSQSAVSRSIKKMSTGPLANPGYGLITVEFDPYDLRRRIIKVSPRGKELVAAMETRMSPMLKYLSKSGVKV